MQPERSPLQLNRIWRGLPLLLFLLLPAWLAACSNAAPPAATIAATAQQVAQEWMAPTPTLVPELATAASGPPTATPTPGPTATNTPPPTPTPLPAEQVAQGEALLAEGDSDGAARAFQAALSVPGALERSEQEAALWGLSRAYLLEERHAEAEDALQRYIALAGGRNSDEEGDGAAGPGVAAPQSDERIAPAQFQLAEAQRAQGDCATALAGYEAYLQSHAMLAAYVQSRIAACHQALGDNAAAIVAYEAAVAAPGQRLHEVETRLKLAALYLANEDYAAAIAQYDAVHDLAQTENTRGEMIYLAGQAELAAGNTAAAHERYRFGVDNYPGSYYSYLGLVKLVDAGAPVDNFQRGLVDYYAQAYAPAIAAFDAVILADPDGYRADTRLYLAWSYEALGNLEAALAQLDAYAQLEVTEAGAPHAAEAAVERARMLGRAGQVENAIAIYDAILADYPGSQEARTAVWQAALLSQRLGDGAQTRARYLQVANLFPDHEEAPRALFRAGMLAWQADDMAAARESWQRLVDGFAQTELGAAALVWLLRITPEDEVEAYVVTATNLSGSGYYALRARDLANGIEPFTAPPALNLEANEAQERAQAEEWLASWLNVEQAEVSSDLPPALAQDARLQRGEQLWALGLYPVAKQELEDLRVAHARDALATYQLALYFRELGLYRSSILAADTLLLLSGQTVFEAPRLIGRLSYPIYYMDLVLRLAENYGYDPLLQFALVRQESLFESFIASHAGAQGLSQVMPATGDDIAARLGWPDYETADLNRPYVGLTFGAYYLSQQLDYFDGDEYVALSAYNGGPGSAMRWHAAAPDDPDLYLETVDFSETRSYIQRIYSGYVAYRWLYGAQ